MLTRIIATLTALMTLACLGAWGRDGHSIIAEIAWRDMTPTAQARAKRILAGQSMPEVSAWADGVRRTEAYRWTAPLHYVNLPAGRTEYNHDRDCPDVGCVVSAVHDFSKLLLHPDADEKTREDAMKFIIHFVGDLHQPLHAGRPEDRGANDIQTVFMGRERNLHSVWDSGILGVGESDPWPVLAERWWEEITDRDRTAWLADANPDDLIGTVGRWTFESHRLAERYAYPVQPGAEIGRAYVEQTLPVVRLRIQQAGVRLGALLNELLDPDADGLSPHLAPIPAPRGGDAARGDER
ncbi:MAG: S1/P1 nuclease [Phycisphaerales bacterium]|nr:S1/P1 nuclease [Planctomycetota bacterium]MCH8507664.1 S1/P1 nuclease [Phycisphaerales bacterium]